MAAKLIQIIYKDSQASECYPFAELYFNPTLTIFFENDVIKNLVPIAKTEKIAVCSWKLQQKRRYNPIRQRELTQEILESDYDVLSFTNNTKMHRMLAAAARHHKGFTELMTKMLHLASIPLPGEVKVPIYQNHFSARTDIYRDYVKEYLIPCMWLMENEPELNKLGMSDSNYSNLNKSGAVDSDYLMEKLGVPYYPLAPFVLERLFSIYIHNKRIRVTQL